MSWSKYNWINDSAPAIDANFLNALDDEIIRLDNAKINKTGNVTVDGIKTFTSSPIVPMPTTEFQVATKKYVDDNAYQGVTAQAGTYDIYSYAKDVDYLIYTGLYVEAVKIRVPFSGTYTVAFTLSSGGTVTTYGRIYVNNSAVGTERSIQGGTSTYTQNITVNKNDVIQLYTKSTSQGSYKNFRVMMQSTEFPVISQIATEA